MSTTSIFRSLEGRWSFAREMTHFGKKNACLNGTACFKRLGDENHYHYREEGILVIQGSEHMVYREYLYEYEDDKISVFFYEVPKRFFHTLTFDNSFRAATARHHCSADIYDARYEFLNENAFKLIYTIEGPSKSAHYITNFAKKIKDVSN